MTEKTKRCGNGETCIHSEGPVLPMSEYYSGTRWLCKPCMRRYRKDHHAENREHDNARSRAYIEQNKDRVYEHNREYRKRPEIRERERIREREKYNTDPQVRAMYIANTHNVRAKHFGVESTLRGPDLMTQYESQKRRCWYCQCELGPFEWHTDHRVPLFRGGNNTAANVVISCESCNLLKNKKLPHEWGKRLL